MLTSCALSDIHVTLVDQNKLEEMQQLLASIEQGNSLTEAGEVYSPDDAISQLQQVEGVTDLLANRKVKF